MAAVLGNEQGENVGLAPTINRSVQSATDWSFPPERPNSGQITAKTKENFGFLSRRDLGSGRRRILNAAMTEAGARSIYIVCGRREEQHTPLVSTTDPSVDVGFFAGYRPALFSG